MATSTRLRRKGSAKWIAAVLCAVPTLSVSALVSAEVERVPSDGPREQVAEGWNPEAGDVPRLPERSLEEAHLLVLVESMGLSLSDPEILELVNTPLDKLVDSSARPEIATAAWASVGKPPTIALIESDLDRFVVLSGLFDILVPPSEYDVSEPDPAAFELFVELMPPEAAARWIPRSSELAIIGGVINSEFGDEKGGGVLVNEEQRLVTFATTERQRESIENFINRLESVHGQKITDVSIESTAIGQVDFVKRTSEALESIETPPDVSVNEVARLERSYRTRSIEIGFNPDVEDFDAEAAAAQVISILEAEPRIPVTVSDKVWGSSELTSCQPVSCEPAMRGGVRLTPAGSGLACTSGFVITNGVRNFPTTAAHCANTMDHSSTRIGSYLWNSPRNGANGMDIKWLNVNNDALWRPDGLILRDRYAQQRVTGVRPQAFSQIGETACYSGASHFVNFGDVDFCHIIQDHNAQNAGATGFNSGLTSRTTSGASQVCSPGDSGAVVYSTGGMIYGNQYARHLTAGGTAGAWCYFSWASDMEATMNVDVVETPRRPLEYRALSSQTQVHSGWAYSSSERDFDVTAGGIPSWARAALVVVRLSSASTNGYGRIYPNGSPSPTNTSNINYRAGQTIEKTVVVGVGSGGNASIRLSSGQAYLRVETVGYFANSNGYGSEYTPITPDRVWDGTTNGRYVQVSGAGDIPFLVPSGATAVAVNVTVAGASGSGSLWAGSSSSASNSGQFGRVYYGANAQASNMMVLKPDSSGRIYVDPSTSKRVIVDVVGYWEIANVDSAFSGSPFHLIRQFRTTDVTMGAGAILRSAPSTVPDSAEVLFAMVGLAGSNAPVFMQSDGIDSTPDTSVINKAYPTAQTNHAFIRLDGANAFFGNGTHWVNASAFSRRLVDAIGYVD